MISAGTGWKHDRQPPGGLLTRSPDCCADLHRPGSLDYRHAVDHRFRPYTGEVRLKGVIAQAMARRPPKLAGGAPQGAARIESLTMADVASAVELVTRVLRVHPGDRGEQFASDITDDSRQMFVAKANGRVIAYGRVAEMAADEAAPGAPAGWYLSGVLVEPAWSWTWLMRLSGSRWTRPRFARDVACHCGGSFPALPGSSRRTEIRHNPRSRILVSTPCSAGWSGSRPTMTVWMPSLLTWRPLNQSAHRTSRTLSTRIS